MTAVTPIGDGPKRTAAGRVLALLGAFEQGHGSLTLSEISRRADLTLTTTHRLVQEVLAWGGLEVDDCGHYRLGQKILELASASTQGLHLREQAQAHLAELHRRTGMTVLLGVRDGSDVMYVDALRPHANFTGENRIGGRLGLHVTATGLVLLAYAPAEVIEQYLRRPLTRYTPHTIAEPAALRMTLQTVRQDRFALARQMLTMRGGSLGAPIVGPDGAVVAAAGLVYVEGSHDPQRYVDALRATAGRISQGLLERRTPLSWDVVEFNRRHAMRG